MARGAIAACLSGCRGPALLASVSTLDSVAAPSAAPTRWAVRSECVVVGFGGTKAWRRLHTRPALPQQASRARRCRRRVKTDPLAGAAASSGDRNDRVEHLRWCPPSQSLSRTIVEGLSDGVQIGRRLQAQVAALGQVLADQPIGVLVRAALPG